MEAMSGLKRLMVIERELAGPDGANALARYDAVLARLDVRLESAMKDGLAPEEYPSAEALREANLLARKLLRLAVRDGGEA